MMEERGGRVDSHMPLEASGGPLGKKSPSSALAVDLGRLRQGEIVLMICLWIFFSFHLQSDLWLSDPPWGVLL